MAHFNPSFYTLSGDFLEGGMQWPFSAFLVYRSGHTSTLSLCDDPTNSAIVDDIAYPIMTLHI